jgi:hypothetical protein
MTIFFCLPILSRETVEVMSMSSDTAITRIVSLLEDCGTKIDWLPVLFHLYATSLLMVEQPNADLPNLAFYCSS